jgi:hypothetical protein
MGVFFAFSRKGKSMSYPICALQDRHLQQAFALTQRLKWPHRLADWLNTLGLVEVDRPVAMIHGKPWQPQGMLAFGLMSQAMA